jgi:hypothetical protein
LHLSSNALTELVTIIEQGSRDREERARMVTLEAALMRKDAKVLQMIRESMD